MFLSFYILVVKLMKKVTKNTLYHIPLGTSDKRIRGTKRAV